MKLDIDKEQNVAYLSLREIKPGEVKRTVPLDDDALMIDFSEDGEVLGIEFLNASTQLRTVEITTHEMTAPLPPDYWETAQ